MLLEEIQNICKVSEFSILAIGQNRKLENLGKCSFTSSFHSSSNLGCKNNKRLTETKTYRPSSAASRRKIENS